MITLRTFCDFNCALLSHPNQGQLVAMKRWLAQVTIHMKCVLSDFYFSFLIDKFFLQIYNIHGLFNYAIGLGGHYKDNQCGTYWSWGLFHRVYDARLPWRSELHYLLTIYWRTMWHLTRSLLQTCGLVFPQKRRELIMVQNRFTLTLTNSSTHLSQPFSYFTSCI